MFQPEFYGDIMAFYDKWVAVLKNPKETLAAEKPNSSISQGAFHLSIASAILGFFLGMGMWLISNLNFNVTPVDSAGFDKGIGTGLMYAIIGIILAPIFVIISAFINNAITFLCAKLLSGKGSFTEQFYLYALVQAPFQLIIMFSYLFFLVPIIGLLAFPLIMLLGLVALYYQVLSIAEAHQVSTARALAIALLPVILLGALFILLIIPASVLWYTGVFNPSKFRGGSECGGFGSSTCINQSVSSASSVFILRNALGRNIEVKSANFYGPFGPKDCTIDDKMGAGSKTITATGRIYIECAPSSAPAGSAYDWTLTIEYVDTASGISKTDTGGFFRGVVSGSQYGYKECGGFGVFTCIDQSVTPSSSVFILGNALGRQMQVQSASISGAFASKDCNIDGTLGTGSNTIAPNGKIYIECAPSSAPSGTAFDWIFTINYLDTQSGLEKTDSGGFFRGKISSLPINTLVPTQEAMILQGGEFLNFQFMRGDVLKGRLNLFLFNSANCGSR